MAPFFPYAADMAAMVGVAAATTAAGMGPCNGLTNALKLMDLTVTAFQLKNQLQNGEWASSGMSMMSVLSTLMGKWCFVAGTPVVVALASDDTLAAGFQEPVEIDAGWDARGICSALCVGVGLAGFVALQPDPARRTVRNRSRARHRGASSQSSPEFEALFGEDEPWTEDVPGSLESEREWNAGNQRGTFTGEASMQRGFVFEFSDECRQIATPPLPGGLSVSRTLARGAGSAVDDDFMDERRLPRADGPSRVRRPAIRWGWMSACLLLAAWLGIRGAPDRNVGTPRVSAAALESTAPVQAGGHLPARPELRTRPIEDVRVGERVVAVNPELAGEGPPALVLDPERVRLVVLYQAKADGDELTVETLMPVEALVARLVERVVSETASEPVPVGAGARLAFGPLPAVDPASIFEPLEPADAGIATGAPLADALLAAGLADTDLLRDVLQGESLELNLPELGAEGAATVLDVRPCPPIEPDDGAGRRLVTSVFRHTAANVVDLETTGSDQPIGTTANHPFWSETRQEFVRAGLLQPGELLRSARGTLVQVTRITPRRGPPVPVFNLEIEGQHVYSVGADGLLVHNNCNIVLGLGEHLADFRVMLTKSYSFKKLEMFPFRTMVDQRLDDWNKIHQAMMKSGCIHFNMQGIDPSVFRNWMRSGASNIDPFPGSGWFANRELYESLTTFLPKTTFYDQFGSMIDAPLHWLSR